MSPETETIHSRAGRESFPVIRFPFFPMGSVVNSLFLFLSLPLSVCLSLTGLLTDFGERPQKKQRDSCLLKEIWKKTTWHEYGGEFGCATVTLRLKLCLDAPPKKTGSSHLNPVYTLWWHGSEYLSGWFEKQSAQGWIKYYTRTHFKQAGAISDGKRNHLFIYLFLKSRNLLCSPLASREC